MRIHIKASGFEHTPSVDALAEEKLIRPVEHLLSGWDAALDIPFDIEFELTTHHHRKGNIWRAEAQLALPGDAPPLRAEATGGSLEEAANVLKSTLLEEIKAFKERVLGH